MGRIAKEYNFDCHLDPVPDHPLTGPTVSVPDHPLRDEIPINLQSIVHQEFPLSIHTPKNSQFCCNCLPTASGGSQQYTVVRVIQCVEDLCLDWVEVLEGVQLLKAGVLQGRDREGVEVKKLGVRRV